jgi:hypothetical protein
VNKIKNYLKGPGGISLGLGFAAGVVAGQATSVATRVRDFVASTFDVELEALPLTSKSTVEAKAKTAAK